jgi:hypothetical protein
MAATKGDGIRANIIEDFTYKVRNYVESSTTLSSDTVFIDINATAKLSAANIIGGAAQATTDPGGPTSSSGATVDLAFLIANLRNWMTIYSRSHKVAFRNLGTGGVPASTNNIERVIRLNTDHGTSGAVLRDFDSATSSFSAGTPLKADDLNELINSCQEIWKARCKNGAPKHVYTVNYCHASHVSHSNHGSRGRR